ncbi:lignostilbene dioxygenase family [Fusarium phyllophilum]|uniref:Lignostilbene dioxygenase family n=1 Tax=Fusarium phyllophilum TaxID=47803 RepID=A0A8H5IES6_9HYPO|nr:lignostilbene dioxygenase family [Fusarium phyllophilum]
MNEGNRSTKTDLKSQLGTFGLPSTWSSTLFPFDNGVKGRFEAEAANLNVYGEIPKELNGTFYRIMVDPFYPLQEGNPPIEGDGNICAFRIQDGQVDMKTRYVDTDRLRLERRANKRLFGLYRNPFSHHPCVRSAVDSTANTNLVFWAGKLVALKESALPYEIEPNSLETLSYDPFVSPGKTFTAHPKADPYSDELVVFGYEAKGLLTDDIVIYALDKQGKIHDEQWIKSPWVAFIHDCAITTNFVILVLWPYEANQDPLKEIDQHWNYSRDLKATVIVVPRRHSGKRPAGWKVGEHRVYSWDHALLLHTAGAWEEWSGEVGNSQVKLKLETSRMMYNPFPMFEKSPPAGEAPDLSADYVRWTLDLSAPTGARIPDPHVVLDMPSEMARIDERFLGREYNRIFCPVIIPNKASPMPPILPPGLNGYVIVDRNDGEEQQTALFDPGAGCTVEEPVFVPRSKDATEGDGWVLGMVHRIDIDRSDVVILDTKHFETPVAVVQLPFRTKSQVHGNWVDADATTEPLVRPWPEVKLRGRGALDPEN